MFTQADVNAVIAHNNSLKIKIFTVKNNKVRWDLRNGELAYLNSVLSKQIVTQNDFAQLKKQVRATLTWLAMLAVYEQTQAA